MLTTRTKQHTFESYTVSVQAGDSSSSPNFLSQGLDSAHRLSRRVIICNTILLSCYQVDDIYIYILYYIISYYNIVYYIILYYIILILFFLLYHIMF